MVRCVEERVEWRNRIGDIILVVSRLCVREALQCAAHILSNQVDRVKTSISAGMYFNDPG